jgi:8-oxo-dGTP diphosphatase
MNSVYRPPILTIDGVVFQIINGALSVLLIKRRNDPFNGRYALPGGYNPEGETTTDALSRILKTKAGVDAKNMGLVEQLYTFDAIGRDPRGHAVSLVYMALSINVVPVIGKNTEEPEFFSLKELPELAYDHTEIIKYAHDRLKSKIGYTNAVFALLPPHFTLSQLQSAYETILGHSLDKRNFRKKFLALNALEATKETVRDGAHRPAQLYRFKEPGLKSLSRDFDWA